MHFLCHIRRTDACWMWEGDLHPDGYGRVYIPDSLRHQLPRKTHAHRVMYILLHGPLPPGMVVRHTCDNPRCVRPDHLVPGTQKDNIQDCIRRKRRASFSGEHNGRAKLTADQARQIRDAPGSYEEIGRQYGVTGRQVAYIKAGKR